MAKGTTKTDGNNTVIMPGLRADIMRNLMETKDTLTQKGSLYIGSGNKTIIDGVEIFQTVELPTGGPANAGKVLTVSDDGGLEYRNGSITKNENGSYVFNELEAKANGDVLIGKNLQAKGDIEARGDFVFLGLSPFDGSSYGLYIGDGSGIYNDSQNNIIVHGDKGNGIYLLRDGTVYIESFGGKILDIGTDNMVSIDGARVLTEEDFTNTVQRKLYRHVISLSRSGSTANDTCRLEWLSHNNLKCDSLQDLRTVLGNPQMNSYVASNPSGDLFCVVISPSTAQFKKVGEESLANITTVSDNVTTL